MLKAACKGPGRDSNSQRESYECDTLPLNHLHLQRHMSVNNLSQTCYSTVRRPGVEPATSRSQVQRPNHYTTEPPRHVYFEHNRISHRHHRGPATYQVGQHRAVKIFLCHQYNTLGVSAVRVAMFVSRRCCASDAVAAMQMPSSDVLLPRSYGTDTALFRRLCKKSNCNSREERPTTV